MSKPFYMTLGALIAAIAIVVVAQVSAQEEVFLPALSSGTGVSVNSADTGEIQLPDCELDEESQAIVDAGALKPSDSPYVGAPVLRCVEDKMTPEEAALLLNEIQQQERKTVIVAGKETAGMTLTIAGHDLTLPETVYIAHRIDEISMPPGEPIPETPIYVLRGVNHDGEWDTLIVEGDGVPRTYSDNPAMILATHRDIVDVFGGELTVVDPSTNEVISNER